MDHTFYKNIPDISETEFLEIFLSSAPAALAFFDRNMNYIMASKRWLEDFQLSDVIGKNHYEVHPDLPERWKNVHERALSGETLQSVEDYYDRDSSSPMWLKWEVRPWHHKNGGIGGIVIFAEDITAMKHVEDDLRRSEDLLQKTGRLASVGGWEFNIQTTTLSWTEEVYRIHELSPNEEVSLERAIAFYPEPYDALVQENVENAIKKKEAFSFRAPLITALGNEKWVRSQGQAEEKDGEVVRVYGTFQDITEAYEREKELEHARMEADTLNQMKSQLMANVCHEIRTPLNAVLGLTQLTLDTELSEDQRGYLNDSMKCAGDLMTLLDDIINFSKIEVGTFKIDPSMISLSALLERVLTLTKSKAAEKAVKIQMSLSEDLPEVLMLDEVRVGQILINLINNAIKFSEEKSRVSVSIDKKPDADILLGTVVDTGIGIPVAKQDEIFNSFSQADTSITRQYGGFGLGLSIVKKLVELMEGKISLQSVEGKGTTFTFELPYGQVAIEAHAAQDQEIQTKIPRQKVCESRVLLAEDNVINQKLMKSLLENFGCTVQVVENGKLACDVLCSDSSDPEIDIVLMDCQMPEMGGIEATRVIREFEKQSGRFLPIIALTGDTGASDRERCIEAGMNGFLCKPVDRDSLYETILKFSC